MSMYFSWEKHVQVYNYTMGSVGNNKHTPKDIKYEQILKSPLILESESFNVLVYFIEQEIQVLFFVCSFDAGLNKIKAH